MTYTRSDSPVMNYLCAVQPFFFFALSGLSYRHVVTECVHCFPADRRQEGSALKACFSPASFRRKRGNTRLNELLVISGLIVALRFDLLQKCSLSPRTEIPTLSLSCDDACSHAAVLFASDGTFDGDNVEWNSLLAGPTNENGPAGTSSRGSSGDGGEGGADGESGINENGGAGEGNANSAADDLPYVVDLSIESDEDDGPAAAPQPPASRCRSSSTTATSPSTQMSLSQQRANGVAIGGGSGSGGSAGGARGSTEATLLHHPNSSPTDSLGSTDDSGDNSSSTPPVAGGSCGGATGGGTQHSSKLSSACASGAVRGKERAAAAALGGVAGATAPSHFIGNSGGGSGMRASSTPSQMNALRRAKNASGMGMAIDSGGAMGGEASGGGREGSAGFWNDNPLVSYTTGYANPVAGGAGGGAGAAAASHLTSGGTSSNRSGDRRSQSTGWPMSPRGQLDIRRDGQRYQPQHPSFSGDAPFGSGEALIGYGGGGEGTGRRGMNGAGWGAFAGGGGHGAIGWQSGMVGMGGGGSGPSQSLKRPRSSSQSDDYQVWTETAVGGCGRRATETSSWSITS